LVFTVALAFAVFGTCLALGGAGVTIISTLKAMNLRDEAVELPAGTPWPRVSIIVPACNEFDTMPAAAETLLSIDYPNLEILLINDRSDDGTGDIIDALAARDERVKAVHVRELPEGWLGKVNALNVGTQKASGELLLFTDADVHFEPDCLRRAVTWMEREQLGHMTLLPRLIGNSFAMNAATSFFAVGYLLTVRVWKVGKPGSKAYAGVGAFGLVRRTDFEKSPGWEWLRLELGDDVGLGMMMVREAGVRSRIGIAADHLSIRWYNSLWGLVRGLEKNSFGAILGFQVWRTVVACFLLLMVSLGPIAALISGVPWVQALGGAVFVLMVVLASTFRSVVHQPFVATLFSPFGVFVLIVAMVNSTWMTIRNKGVCWRGTHYELSELREGRRVDF
jgi:glycosyltransferase involved in cell wall biosynthesis